MSVRVERDGPVTTVILDRPAVRNAVDGPTAAALADAFRQFDADDSARAAVLYGAGGTFCAGADLKAIGGPDGNRAEPDGDGPMGPTRMRLSKPVIAAISGHAVAGGLELALWCDLRVAEDDAILGVVCRGWGVPLIDGGTVRLPRVVGLGRALDLTLAGRPVPADEALAMGLVSRVVPAGEARGAAEALARDLAALPQACLRSDRQSALESLSLTEDAALAGEFRHGMSALAAPGLADEIGRFRASPGGRPPLRFPGGLPPEPPAPAIADSEGTRLRRTPPRQPMPGGTTPAPLSRGTTPGAPGPAIADEARLTGTADGGPPPALDHRSGEPYNYEK